MERSSEQRRKGVRTRSKRNVGEEEAILVDNSVCVSGGVSLAPTAQLAQQKKDQELDTCKLRLEWQNEKISELTKERDYLKEQLASALKRESTGSSQAAPLSANVSSVSSADSSSDAVSDTSSNTLSPERNNKKKKRTKQSGKDKKFRKKSREMEPRKRQRVQNPQQAVTRYQKVLQYFTRGWTMSAAFKRVGVDRNTVVVNASIAELYITAPVTYQELLKNHSSEAKLSAFATQCSTAIQTDPAIEDTVKAFKASGKLLPLKQK